MLWHQNLVKWPHAVTTQLAYDFEYHLSTLLFLHVPLSWYPKAAYLTVYIQNVAVGRTIAMFVLFGKPFNYPS